VAYVRGHYLPTVQQTSGLIQETGAKRSAKIFEGIQHPENISCSWSVGVPAGVRVVLGHFIFVYIHPYMDGNGRMGRFLMNVMLAGGG
jgi:hypothetical protein